MDVETPNKTEASRRALVLCGGGARGAMEVGFYQALTELGIRFDLVVGSSIGALNGAYIAAGVPPEDLAALWRGVTRRDVCAWNWRGFLTGNAGSLYSLEPLRRLILRTLPAQRFEALKIPLVITTTDLQSGQAVYWAGPGDLVEPLVASVSLPGIFPPVSIGQRQHVDGAVTSNVPFEPAVARGARELLLILCTCCPPPEHAVRSALGALMRSFLIALDRKYGSDLNHYQRQGISIRVVRPSLSQEVGLLDFRHTGALIRAGYEETLRAFRESSVAQLVAS